MKLQKDNSEPTKAPQIKKVKITPLQEKQCLNGNAEICYQIATSYKNAQDINSAYNYFEIGCNLDHGTSCFEAGKIREIDNPLEGELFQRKACRFKNGDACLYLSNLIEGRKKLITPVDNQEKDKEENKEKEKSEDKEEQNLIGNSEQSEFVEFEDHAGDVLMFLIQSCDYKSKEGCMRLALHYDQKSEYDKAFVFFRRACYLDQVAGCYNAGVMQTKMGQEALGLEYFILACDKKNSEACFTLAIFYSKKSQNEKGLHFLERALTSGKYTAEQLKNESALDNIRELPKYTQLVMKYCSPN